MTDIDYVTQVVDALWEAVDDKGIRGRLYREDVEYLAEVLAAAGLIPTSTAGRVHYACDEDEESECGMHYRITPDVADRVPCEHATFQTRPVHDWKDATDD